MLIKIESIRCPDVTGLMSGCLRNCRPDTPVYASDVYYSVCLKEDIINTFYLYCNIVTLTYYIDIINIDIDGNYAQVYVHTTSFITACGYYETYDKYEYGNLQKVGNSWKLY